jgi:hypothetical protein
LTKNIVARPSIRPDIRPGIRYPAHTGYPVSGFWISRISGASLVKTNLKNRKRFLIYSNLPVISVLEFKEKGTNLHTKVYFFAK